MMATYPRWQVRYCMFGFYGFCFCPSEWTGSIFQSFFTILFLFLTFLGCFFVCTHWFANDTNNSFLKWHTVAVIQRRGALVVWLCMFTPPTASSQVKECLTVCCTQIGHFWNSLLNVYSLEDVIQLMLSCLWINGEGPNQHFVHAV